MADRYPLPYPPKLAGGGTSAVEESAEFLQPGANLREGVQIAKTPPRVEFSFYPQQNYPGNPWSHRSDGFVKGDKYYSSSNDHLAPRGTAHLWEYDAVARSFRLLCDTSKFLESQKAFPASMNYRPGEMQSRIDMGSDGWLYYATDRGSPTATHDGNGWLGEWLLRTHPQTLKSEIVATHPIPKHTIPASVLDPDRMILYCGTAPGRDAENQNVQFFAFDLKSRKILKIADGGPTRTIIFSPSTGRVFWEGSMYDPRTNQITPVNVPHVRSCSPETPQGLVYGTSGTKADLWSLNVNTLEVKQLGTAAVGNQEYIASIEADPTGRYLYYVPGAHGGATRDGTPIVQYDTRTGKRKVLAFLHELFWNKHGYALDGSFGNALDEKGERFFISWDGWRKGQPRGWESASITVVHIPPSERVVDSRAKVVDSLRESTAFAAGEPIQAVKQSEAIPAAANSRSELTTIPARKLFEQSTSQNLELSSDGTAVQLSGSVLIEDDGPAAGYSYQPNEELLGEGIAIKKELIVDRPAARRASLLIGRQPGRTPPPLKFTINGRQVELELIGHAGRNWEVYDLDPDLLKAGKNEIVLSGGGKIWIARDDEYAAGSRERTSHPNRSAKSVDGGKTWDYKHLGTKGDIDGEYYVRLFLEQHRAEGVLTTPVISLDADGPVAVSLGTESGGREGVRLRARSGNTFVPGEKSWSPWQELTKKGTIDQPRGRYVQVEVAVTSHDPLNSPRLTELKLKANSRPAEDWLSKRKIVNQHNEAIVRSSIPFEYEPFDHPQLKTLRQKYNLDEVVKDTRTEFELICRLAAWASQRWEKGHLAQVYPAWNALEIMSPYTDGKPIGGFCQHYNLVFLQACESYGLVGRAISIDRGTRSESLPVSGHEVVEIWSNEHKKWIYIDGNCAWYFVDQKTRTPLSLWELRDRQLCHFDKQPYEPIEVVQLAETRFKWENLDSWPTFSELRLIPRSNFLAEKSPLPLNQGMRGWFWTGHYVWHDERAPATLLYGNRITKRSDFEWTLNQAHYNLEPLPEPGQFRVHLDTVTPGFKTFVARIDNEPSQEVDDGFVWKLHSGRNRLEVRPQNIAGREGIASWIEMEWPTGN